MKSEGQKMGDGTDYRSIFETSLNVSRETMARLDTYALLLKKWNKAINLVSPTTVANLWPRHFLDSAQILEFAPKGTKTWVDIGSGAGFPGLIVSCLNPDIAMTCIESDQRKSVFMQTVIRELDLNAKCIVERIEKVPPSGADVLSARALAPITHLLDFATQHLKPSGTAIFLKGSGHLNEIREAQKKWTFDIDVHSSKTNPEGAVLVLGDIRSE